MLHNYSSYYHYDYYMTYVNTIQVTYSSCYHYDYKDVRKHCQSWTKFCIDWEIYFSHTLGIFSLQLFIFCILSSCSLLLLSSLSHIHFFIPSKFFWAINGRFPPRRDFYPFKVAFLFAICPVSSYLKWFTFLSFAFLYRMHPGELEHHLAKFYLLGNICFS